MNKNHKKKVRITFYGGIDTPTGSNFLLETGEGEQAIRILIDCGLKQGSRICDDENWQTFPYRPEEIDAVIITHAHLDHTGRLPSFVRAGFAGTIYSTHPTKEIGLIMLEDSIRVLTKEAHECRREPIYNPDDIKNTQKIWKGIAYHESISFKNGISFVLRDAGHILGSSMVEFLIDGAKIVFSGDLGNSPAPLLKDTEKVTDANYLILESVYGDRKHPSKEGRKEELEDVIENSVKKGGALLVPAFSVERTQELLFEINDLVSHGRIPPVPIFVDSPLAIKVTDVYKKSGAYFNKEARYIIKSGDDIFKFPNLVFTFHHHESEKIAETPNPKVIIAGSGMSNGGRIVRHEQRHLPDPKSSLLIVGYQAAGTLGRELLDGAKKVRIMGEDVVVRANVIDLSGYSAHRDSDGLFQFVSDTADTVKRVYVVMGEPKASLFLVQKLRDYLGVDARAPKRGETVELDL
ncbi:MBL fold metallo-hydrolase [bacterium]|nr:MBL fold metallo-hydrolase [bacterium]